MALLLQCNKHSQLPIIERMLKLALVFSQNDVDSNAYKNHLIAKAIMTILYTNETAPNKRNEISTPQLLFLLREAYSEKVVSLREILSFFSIL